MKNKINKTFLAFMVIWIASCNPCDNIEPTECGGSSFQPKVDLVVIIDTSGSMSSAGAAVSNASETAILSSQGLCNTDLRVVYLGLEAIFPGTVFDETQRAYLLNLDPSFSLAADVPPVGQPSEQGADAVSDISNFFDWRNGACRSILYISDEPLDGNQSAAQTDMAINNAIASANMNEVSVFSIFFPGPAFNMALHYDEYDKMCLDANGMAFFDTSVNQDTYISLMPQVVCNACNACSLNDLIN